METQVRTPQMVFMQPQRLVVPLFQRPYVWNEENQWEPLWEDAVRVAERILSRPADKHHPHFLGAVVLQQVQKPTGQMQERTIIDGQQRLTTLQLLLDALHAELMAVFDRFKRFSDHDAGLPMTKMIEQVHHAPRSTVTSSPPHRRTPARSIGLDCSATARECSRARSSSRSCSASSIL